MIRSFKKILTNYRKNQRVDISSMFHLSLTRDEVNNRLTEIENVRNNSERIMKQQCDSQKREHSKKMLKTFYNLNGTVDKLCNLFENDNKGKNDKGSSTFLFQQPQHELFREEEQFCAELTNYTRKQFFQGFADLVGGGNQYELLDLSKPESQLIKSESQSTKLKDREELRRLQSQYVVSEERRINDDLENIYLHKQVEIASQQLELLKTGNITLNPQHIQDKLESLTKENQKLQIHLKDSHQSTVLPLLHKLQELHPGKVLKGNYDMKISRQDYFLSKQNELINQLLLQCSRNHLLSMLYEMELNKHRSSYHMIASVKTLLSKEIQDIDKRIAMLKDPLLLDNNSKQETIRSQDSFVTTLYDAIMYNQTSTNELYRSYNQLANQSQLCSKKKSSLVQNVKKDMKEYSTQFEIIETSIQEIDQLLWKRKSASSEEVAALIDYLEENLYLAETQVNEIIKVIVAKRKILSTDSLKVMERSLFTNFFNDPARMKRSINDLETSVKSFNQ